MHQLSLWRFSLSWWILQKILHVIAGAERISSPVPEHDACLFILGRGIEDIRESHIHARSHRVSFRRTIQLNAKDASGTFGKNLIHCLVPLSANEIRVRPRYRALAKRGRPPGCDRDLRRPDILFAIRRDRIARRSLPRSALSPYRVLVRGPFFPFWSSNK